MLRLYFFPGSSSLASHIALEEAGAEFELIKVDLASGEHKSRAYLAVNPAGSTPALATDNGVLTENVAILAYLAQTYPEAKLADLGSSFRFGQMQAFNSYLASSLHHAIGRVAFANPPLEGQVGTAATEAALLNFQHVEDNLLRGPWVLGETYTVADGYLCVFARWARIAGLLNPKRLPRLNDHLDRVQARPAVRRALETEGTPVV